ncbi:8605_t:CDS:2 [Paraglomus brasilianum]|uniref:8605_t:CDS:1 n=1 Tax=Paraglomus brasilianum TaxID=144538 RepID=A0A9N9CEH2_9GLOM|nr:8605_t:CDS:2 [Paraglomus brasilianum]
MEHLQEERPLNYQKMGYGDVTEDTNEYVTARWGQNPNSRIKTNEEPYETYPKFTRNTYLIPLLTEDKVNSLIERPSLTNAEEARKG